MTASTKPAQKASKGRIKSSTVAVYVSIFTLLVAIIGIGYRAPEQQVSGVSPVATVAPAYDQPAVNDVVATDIAASVAKAASLAIAPNVAELAVSTRVQSEYQNASDGSSIAKPAIVELSTASRGITQYTTQPGDTVSSVAAKYGLAATTVKWANNLTGESLAVGVVLDILPRDGIVYTVKDGDTLEKLATRYNADASLIVTYNDLELKGLTTGLKIVIPAGVLPETERPGYIAPAVRYTSGFITGVGVWSGEVLSMRIFRGVDANSGGYAPGNCTAYAYFRRAQLGMPVPRNLGNAYTWATVARDVYNMTVNSTPSVGAVIQAGNHVGIVEEIYDNGSLRITDMNYGYRIYNLAERIIPASAVGNYAYIH